MGARVRNRSQGEHFWGNSRGCVKVSLEGVSPFVDRQSTNAPPGGSSGRLSLSVVNQGANVRSAVGQDPS